MRACIFIFVAGASLAAQTQAPTEQSQPEKPPAAQPKKPKEGKPGRDETRRKSAPQLQGDVAVSPGGKRQCAIPLTNVLRPSGVGSRPVNGQMPRVVPPKGHFPMKQVIVPAPSCDDVK